MALKKKTKKTSQRARKIHSVQPSMGFRYSINSDFEFYNELRGLVLKSSPAERKEMATKIHRLGRVKLAVVAGLLINQPNDGYESADLFLVADDLDRAKLNRFLKALEADVGTEIKFAVMESEEYKYRIGMFDRFLNVLFEGPHEKLIDRLNS